MSVRSFALSFAVAALGVSAVHAAGSTFVGGEAGWIDQPVQSSVTRDQVRKELAAFRSNPLVQGGSSLYVGGEMGYVDLAKSTTTREAVRSELLQRQASLRAAVQAP